MTARGALMVALTGLAASGPLVSEASAAATWQLAPVASPETGTGQFSLGDVGDLKVVAPNRAILTTEGTAVMPRGIYAYDGRRWRVLASVCGGEARNARLAVASPSTFWAIADTNPAQLVPQVGVTLCRFADGAVTSFAVPGNAQDQWFPMRAATCVSETECWFGGQFGQSNDQVRSGGFRLRATGTTVESVYAPLAVVVNDIEGFRGDTYEALGAATSLSPMLVRRSAAGFSDAQFAAPVPGSTTEIVALDASPARLWLGGGSAATVAVPSRVLPFVSVSDGETFTPVDLSGAGVRVGDRIADIAAVPGTDRAWAVVQNLSEVGSADVSARVVLLDAATGVVSVNEVPALGNVVRGAGVRIDCAAIDDCWLATAGGWLYHLTDGTAVPQDTGFFDTVITSRPRDGRSPQVRPDTAPIDDSLLFAAAPEPKSSAPKPPKARRPVALIARVKAKVRGRRALVVSFSVRRPARVRVVGTRGGKVVARSPRRTLKRGRHSLVLPLNPKRYPTGIKFQTTDLERPAASKSAVSARVVTTDVTGAP